MENYYNTTLFSVQRAYETGKRDELEDIMRDFQKQDNGQLSTRYQTALERLRQRSVHHALRGGKASPRRETTLFNSRGVPGNGTIRTFLMEAVAFSSFIAGLCAVFVLLAAVMP